MHRNLYSAGMLGVIICVYWGAVIAGSEFATINLVYGSFGAQFLLWFLDKGEGDE